MLIELTRKGDGVKILVNVSQVKMLEPDSDGVSTHVVLGADLVRVVSEGIGAIASLLGAGVPFKAPLT